MTDSDSHEAPDGFEEYNPPADRFLIAQMWWIASELVRRHPHLRISGVEVDEGNRLVLVHDEQDGMSIQWDLVGGCKFLINGDVEKISWIEMMAALSPHETVKRIEVAAGLGNPAGDTRHHTEITDLPRDRERTGDRGRRPARVVRRAGADDARRRPG